MQPLNRTGVPGTGSGAGRLPAEPLRADAARDLVAAAVAVVLLAAALAAARGLGSDVVARATIVFAAGAVLVWRALPLHPHPRFGAGNRVTLARFALSALLAALLSEPLARDAATAWAVVVVATVAAVADAADGPLARRSGLASAFGARFDMECDAWLTLVLCALVLHFGKAPAWVLASGLMRYAFVAAAWIWPWLAAPLPPRRCRQTVCVVQITLLIVCIGPIVPPPLATTLAALGLAALAASFTIDLVWLARHSARESRP